ncbi:transposase [Streptomyces chiangmaiensis]
MSVSPVERDISADGEVTAEDLAVLESEFSGVCRRISGLFYRPESRGHAEAYLRGLLAPLQKKNGWTIAEHAGAPEPKRMQRFLNLTPWSADELRDNVVGYAMEHFADERGVLFTDAAGWHGTVAAQTERLPRTAFQRRSCGIGTKGFRSYDWALIDAAEENHQYLVRRSIDDGELAYFHCFNPRRESVGELVRAAGRRWPVEECFETAKQEAGLDQYQVRKYDAWYRHITMSMLALCLLAVMRRKAEKGLLDLWTTRQPPGNEPARTG